MGGLATTVLAAGCASSVAAPPLPPAETYPVPSDFTGEWIGEVAGTPGILSIERLGGGRYYATFQPDDETWRYVLGLDQRLTAETPPRATNLAVFKWQDGRGARGHGWLLVNREDNALAGESGYGDAGTLGVVWAFIRLE